MHILDKVDVLESYEEKINSPSVQFQIPAVVRLRKYSKSKPMRIRFSRGNIYNRDNKTCQYCGESARLSDLTMDHVIPKSVGGKTTWTNIVTCCKTCNTAKANRTPQQAGMRLIARPEYPNVKSMYASPIDGTIPKEWENWIGAYDKT
jgi:5-methylcytosine-specific restriction endonuclease McrA